MNFVKVFWLYLTVDEEHPKKAGLKQA